MLLQNSMNNNHKQNQNPTHEQIKSQNKKTHKIQPYFFSYQNENDNLKTMMPSFDISIKQ
jgi:hypothetical protein